MFENRCLYAIEIRKGRIKSEACGRWFTVLSLLAELNSQMKHRIFIDGNKVTHA